MRTSLLLKYCGSDLFSRRVRTSSLFLFGILLLASCVATVCRGLPEFYHFIRNKQLEQKPGALTLHFVAPLLGSFNKNDYDSLVEKFSPLVKDKIVSSIFPNHKVNLEAQLGDKDLYLTISGRIISDKDISLFGELLVDGSFVSDNNPSWKISSDINKIANVVPVIVGKRFRKVLQQHNNIINCKFPNASTNFNLFVIGELADDQSDSGFFYGQKSLFDKLYGLAKERAKKYKTVLITGFPIDATENKVFIQWALRNNFRAPYVASSGNKPELDVINLTNLSEDSFYSAQEWNDVLNRISKELNLIPNKLKVKLFRITS